MIDPFIPIVALAVGVLYLLWRTFPQRVPFHESMTKKLVLTADGNAWNVRVWKRSRGPAYSADPDVLLVLKVQRSDAQALLAALTALPDVAAVEMLDGQGNGGVTYCEWP